MSALVVFESMFGNTKEIACAIAEGIGGHARVTSIEFLTEDALNDVELLVVGGPTHAHGMSRPQTRDDAHRQGAPTAETGVRERLPALGQQVMRGAAAFDTRIDKPRLITGAASKGIERSLRHLGYHIVAPAESFLVDGTKGPLLPGELERARAWGKRLRALMPSAA